METGAEKLVRSLEAQDVEYIFGVCGDTSVGLYRILEEMDHSLEHVLARDERSASYMADAYARLSGRTGVCEGPSGGGATYLTPGLAEANDSSVPVVGLNTTIPTRYRSRGVLTELDQKGLFEPVTKWNASVDHADLLPRMIRQAFKHATSDRPGATHLSLPMDVLNSETDQPVYEGSGSAYPSYRPLPAKRRIERAAELLADSQRPIIVAGGGVHSSRAWDDLRAFCEQVGVPVAQTLTSAGCLGDSPYSVGVIGENGYRAYANDLMTEADVVFLFGTAVESVWTSKWSSPADGTKKFIHADINAPSIGKNYETAVGIPGDLRATIRALSDICKPTSRYARSNIKARHERWVAQYKKYFDSSTFPIRPERMVADTADVLNEDAVIISDPGTSCPYFASLYPFTTTGRHWVTPRAHGALGYTIPGVVGAHYARPDKQIVGFTGDGSFGTSVGELETLARLNLPVTIVVINNESFSWIEAGQRNFADFSFGVDFDSTDFAGVAKAFGISGFQVESAADYKPTLREAMETDGPALVDLPTLPIADIDNVPVDWLEPGE